MSDYPNKPTSQEGGLEGFELAERLARTQETLAVLNGAFKIPESETMPWIILGDIRKVLTNLGVQYIWNDEKEDPRSNSGRNRVLKELMTPSKKILDKLISAAEEVPEMTELYHDKDHIWLAAARGEIGMMNITNNQTVYSYLAFDPIYIVTQKEKGKTINDDLVAFAMAHELGHAQQSRSNPEIGGTKQGEFNADILGILLTHKAGYSVYQAISNFPSLIKGKETATHPGIEDRQLNLIDFALKHDLIRPDELQATHDLQQQLEARADIKLGINPISQLPYLFMGNKNKEMYIELEPDKSTNLPFRLFEGWKERPMNEAEFNLMLKTARKKLPQEMLDKYHIDELAERFHQIQPHSVGSAQTQSKPRTR